MPYKTARKIATLAITTITTIFGSQSMDFESQLSCELCHTCKERFEDLQYWEKYKEPLRETIRENIYKRTDYETLEDTIIFMITFKSIISQKVVNEDIGIAIEKIINSSQSDKAGGNPESKFDSVFPYNAVNIDVRFFKILPSGGRAMFMTI